MIYFKKVKKKALMKSELFKKFFVKLLRGG